MKKVLARALPVALVAILSVAGHSAHAQKGGGGSGGSGGAGGSGSVGYAACDGIISQPTIYYNTANWTNSPTNDGFLFDDAGDYAISCGTSYGNTSASMSASMSNCFQNATGAPATNTFAVNITAGGAVGASSSLYYATSTVVYGSAVYGNTTASGYAPYGVGMTTHTDEEYSVITTTVFPDGDTFTFDGTATGNVYAPASP